MPAIRAIARTHGVREVWLFGSVCGPQMLQPGKPTIEVGAAENLLPTIQAVRETVAAGELDKLLRFQKKLPTYKLLIIDELGFVPLSKTGAELSPPLTYCPAILMQ